MIHYHGTPCGGTREEAARFLMGRHALIPWVRNEDIGTAAEVCQSFCLDNGAFTAWTAGKPITDWEPYFDFVKLWCRHPAYDWAIIPDVIDGDEAANDRLIKKWIEWKGWSWDGERHITSFKSHGVPVWHLHESLERLERLCHGWERVAIGSSGRWATPGTKGWWSRMEEAMEVACDKDGRPRAKLHGLRMLDPAIFHRLPLASADSTNAVRNSSSMERFGMYRSPNTSTRMAVIAERTEIHQSAALWVNRDKQGFLFKEDKEEIQHGQQTPLNIIEPVDQHLPWALEQIKANGDATRAWVKEQVRLVGPLEDDR